MSRAVLDDGSVSLEVKLLTHIQVGSSEGRLREWHCIYDEKFMYIKEPAPADTYECESECIASELAELFGLKHAEYKLGKFKLNQ